MQACALFTASAEDAATALNELLGRMRWSASDFGEIHLMAGQSRRLGGSGMLLGYVTGGIATLGTELLEPGDAVMISRGGAHELAAPGGARFVVGTVTLESQPFERVTELLPDIVFGRGSQAQEPALSALLEMVDHEISAVRPGASTVLNRLVDLVISAMLRSWLENGCNSAHAWLTQLRDPHLGRVLDAIHSQPGSPWTVESLAQLARGSRSQFAERFRASLGESPARYLTRVRMRCAERMLLAGEPVSRIAMTLGYDSDEGFRRAFQRHSGYAPTQWRRSMTQQPVSV